MPMLMNGKTSEHCLNYSGCSCHNTKNARRRAKKSVKAKGKASAQLEIHQKRS